MPSAQARPLFLLASLFAPVGIIAPKALVLLMFITALWLLPRLWRRGQLRRPFQGGGAILAVVIGAWALLSTLWALDGAAAFWTFARLAGVIVATLVLLDSVKELAASDSGPIGRALIAAVAPGALVLGVGSLSGGAP